MTKTQFARRVKHHQSLLGLNMWNVSSSIVKEFEVEGDEVVHGLLEFNRPSMSATVYLLGGLTDEESDGVARHEMLHLRLASYRHLCSSLIENLDENGKTVMYRLLQDIDEQTVIAIERSLT